MLLVDQKSAPALYQYIHDSNLLRQYDYLKSYVNAALDLEKHQIPDQDFLCDLNRIAVVNLSAHAGKVRGRHVTGEEAEVTIAGSEHAPPDASRVPNLFDTFFSFIGHHWEKSDPIWLASYCLWRINWIHPFTQGNGRTARAVCYYVLCVKHGMWLPGTETIPQQLRNDRPNHWKQLRGADLAAGQFGKNDLAELTAYVTTLLKIQLASAEPQAARKHADRKQQARRRAPRGST